jgi:hypothetical protein
MPITINTMNITDVFSSELDRRLSKYRQLIRDTAADLQTYNHQYLCLQEAQYMEQGGVAPAIRKSRDEVFAELRRWRAELQKKAEIHTASMVRRKVELIDEFMQRHSDQAPEAEQTKLF